MVAFWCGLLVISSLDLPPCGAGGATSSSTRGNLLLSRQPGGGAGSGRTAVAMGGGGTMATVGPTCVFFVFLFFQKHFAESLKVLTAHHCREPEIRLKAKSSLPPKLCCERYASGNSRQLLCRE
jgi:hypothetical protein